MRLVLAAAILALLGACVQMDLRRDPFGGGWYAPDKSGQPASARGYTPEDGWVGRRPYSTRTNPGRSTDKTAKPAGVVGKTVTSQIAMFVVCSFQPIEIAGAQGRN